MCIHNQCNISMYYRTQCAIWPIRQVQPNCHVTGIPLTERQRLKDDHLWMSLRFFSLPLGIIPNDKRTAILSGHPSHYVSACTWVWTNVLWVPKQVCYPLGHSGRCCFGHLYKYLSWHLSLFVTGRGFEQVPRQRVISVQIVSLFLWSDRKWKPMLCCVTWICSWKKLVGNYRDFCAEFLHYVASPLSPLLFARASGRSVLVF